MRQKYMFLFAFVMLWFMFAIYGCWLNIAYKGQIYHLRRRDFYLKKAEVLCYYSSKKQVCVVSSCERVSLNLGSGKRYEPTERCLFKKRAPDIKNSLPPIPEGENEPPSKEPVFDSDTYYLFNLCFPGILTALNTVALLYWAIAKI